MIIRSLDKLKSFTAGDGCTLKEILNGATDPVIRGIAYSLAHATVAPGLATIPHSLTSSEVYYILSGHGVMHVGSEKQEVSSGDSVYIPPGSVQFIENRSTQPLEFLCIVDPAWVPECETVYTKD